MKKVWYGGPTLLGVIGGDVLVLLGLGTGITPIAIVGAGSHSLTGPIVHWAHGHVGKGFAALGLTAGLPLIGAALGAATYRDDGSGGFLDLGEFFWTLKFVAVGYILGPTLDLALLSTEEVPVRETLAKGARLLLPTSVGLAPMLDQNRRGLMLVGQF